LVEKYQSQFAAENPEIDFNEVWFALSEFWKVDFPNDRKFIFLLIKIHRVYMIQFQ
jgi:hypothetical protein